MYFYLYIYKGLWLIVGKSQLKGKIDINFKSTSIPLNHNLINTVEDILGFLR